MSKKESTCLGALTWSVILMSFWHLKMYFFYLYSFQGCEKNLSKGGNLLKILNILLFVIIIFRAVIGEKIV